MSRSGYHPGALAVRASAAVRLLLGLAALITVAGATLGAEAATPAETEPFRKDAFRDIQLARKVRDALKEDKQLDLLRLFVTVKDRVAILEGEVVSEEQLRTAAKRVEKVVGIKEVRIALVRVVERKRDDPLTIPLLPEPPTE